MYQTIEQEQFNDNFVAGGNRNNNDETQKSEFVKEEKNYYSMYIVQYMINFLYKQNIKHSSTLITVSKKKKKNILRLKISVYSLRIAG